MSAIILCCVYRSPLDIKSVHKIPANDNRHCGGAFVVHVLAPLSWALICLSVGAASIKFAENSSCGGEGGSGLKGYLQYSGIVMVVLGGALFVLFSALVLFSCAGPTSCAVGFCASVRRGVHSVVLAKAPYVDLWWQLQGVIWSYRAGSFSLAAAIVTGAISALGEVLTAIGSSSPDPVEKRAGRHVPSRV